jgi:hypothetical protein
LNSGFLREKEVDMWRTAAGDPYPMEKNPDEIPMFTRLAERGLALPVSDFFKRLLEYYGIEYLNLNPNGIFHTSVFVHFCEAFLGIKPHWVLFRKFFRVKPQPSANNPRVVGGAGIQMREDAAEQYLAYKLIDSNQDWKSKWFLLTPKNGTGERLTCGPNLVINTIRLGKISSKESVKDACGRQCAIVRQRGCLRF